MQDLNEVAKVIDRVSRVKFNFTGFEPRILQLSPGQVMLSPADIHGALGPIVDQIVELVQGAINASGRDQQPLNLQVGVPAAAFSIYTADLYCLFPAIGSVPRGWIREVPLSTRQAKRKRSQFQHPGTTYGVLVRPIPESIETKA